MIGQRIKELRSEKNLTQSEFASLLGIAKTTLAAYEQEKNEPNIAMLIKMASYFDVTIDYLIGYTDIRTKNIEARAIAEKTGLTLRSIDILAGYQSNATREPEDAFDSTPATASIYLSALNQVLFGNVFENIAHYLFLELDYFYDDDTFQDEDCYKHISELGLFDKKLGIGYCDDHDFFSQSFLLMIQQELMAMRKQNIANLPKRITPIAHEKAPTD
jgi:DNA-binding XRE family transcriptional regulator